MMSYRYVYCMMQIHTPQKRPDRNWSAKQRSYLVPLSEPNWYHEDHTMYSQYIITQLKYVLLTYL